MQIYRLNALSDNYIFLLYDAASRTAAVVDPAEAAPVCAQLEALGASLVAIFNTHHHSDHVGGNLALLERYPQATVYGGAADRGRIPGQQFFLAGGDTVTFAGRSAQVLFVPGHTRAHIAYYFEPADPQGWGDLFCGDTLFAGGCGRLFEGSPEQMVNSLTQLRRLSDRTWIWCAHEYTLNNLTFALAVDGANLALQQRFEQVRAARQQQQATVPSALGLEKATNPFLRWDDPIVQAQMGSQDPVQSFARLRGRKDQF